MDLKHELSVGFSLFLSIAYIYIILPSLYSQAGMSFEQALVGVAFIVAIGTIITATLSKMPVVVIPSIGIAAYAVSLANQGLSWETLMAAVFLEGLAFIALTVTRLREWFALGIPNSIKYAILGGVGLFLISIGLKMGKLAGDGITLLSSHAVLTLLGIIVGGFFISKRVKGAFFLTILFLLSIALLSGVVKPSLSFTTPSFSLTHLDFEGLGKAGLLSIVLAIFMVDFFDTLGASTSLLLKERKLEGKKLKGLGELMLGDAITTSIAPLLGTTASVVALESGIAMHEKAKTIIPSLVVAVLSIGMVFLYPLLSVIPLSGVGALLVLLGALFFSSIKMEAWKEMEEAIPALLTLATIPLTMSISAGIGIGITAYVLINFFLGKFEKLHPAIIAIFLLFLLDYFHVFGGA